jgi:phage recombination protein Bet
MNAIVTWQPNQLALIKRTVAKDCNDDEFNQFIHICKTVRLDPLRRQIYAFVFNKDNPKYRQMTVVTAIGGYRAIAERTASYRPDDRAPRYEMGEKDAKTNPLGILRCEVTVYKRAHGEWFPVVGEAFWDEYVPVRDGVIDPKKTGWVKMPRIMIAKCAEANALRKAWPDDLEGLYEESEIDRRMVDITPSEAVDEAEAERKLALMGGKDALTVMWDDAGKLERVPLGQFADRTLKWAGQNEITSTEVRIWWMRNEPARAEFKAKHGSDYLELQKQIEALTDRKEKAETSQEAAA